MDNHKTQVFIDPRSKVLYSSYYLKGLFDLFGKKNVIFSAKYFKELNRKDEPFSHDHYLALVIKDMNRPLKKIIIDFCDPPVVSEMAYEWSDLYAKININSELTNNRFHDKIISIAPGFGIHIWNIFETAYHLVLNYIKCGFSPLVSTKDFIKDYLSLYRRPALKDYAEIDPADDTINQDRPFVFMIGTLWTHKNCIEGANLIKKAFIESCKALGCIFEGGFFASPEHPQYNEFSDLIFKKRYTCKDYIRKTKASLFVFNTPAVHNCHGWKLGEYLAMNKAIISTPVLNELPENLIHGENIHIIQDVNDLKPAIEFLMKNEDYRKSLERGTRLYYQKYSNPKAVIQRILASGKHL